MKKLMILFLVLMGVVGLMAAPIHPPGVDSPEMVLSGYELIAVTPDTVLTVDPLSLEQPGQVLAVPAIMIMSNSGTPQDCFAITAHNTGQGRRTAPTQPVDFPLLC
jgi:hypothetical protein